MKFILMLINQLAVIGWIYSAYKLFWTDDLHSRMMFLAMLCLLADYGKRSIINYDKDNK